MVDTVQKVYGIAHWARMAQDKLPGGWGVMMDDSVAGVQVAIVLVLIFFIGIKLFYYFFCEEYLGRGGQILDSREDRVR